MGGSCAQVLKQELEEMRVGEQRHLELEKLLKDDIRKLQMTTQMSSEATWLEKREYVRVVFVRVPGL